MISSKILKNCARPTAFPADAMKKLFIFLLAAILSAICAFPEAAENQPPVKAQAPTLDQMLGSMLMFGFRGAALAPDDEFLKMVSDGKIGNMVLFDRDVTKGGERNINSKVQVQGLTKTLIDAAPFPLFISVDQEGGQVRRLKPQKGFMDLPSAQAMAQRNATATRELAAAIGAELKSLGINMDLAPVLDVDSNPFNPGIGRLGRSFSSDPGQVVQHALAFGLGLANAGVVPVLKHFPGQGCATEDSHLGLPDITQCWNPEIDLRPYAEIFSSGWPGAVMIGHMLHRGFDGELPSTLSKKIITGLLRNGLKWQGVIISDDMQMKAVAGSRELKETLWLAIDAGIDILLFGNNLEWDAALPQKVWDALKALQADGRLTEERIKESWQRISALHAAYNN